MFYEEKISWSMMASCEIFSWYCPKNDFEIEMNVLYEILSNIQFYAKLLS